jgi:hypothetical protein
MIELSQSYGLIPNAYLYIYENVTLEYTNDLLVDGIRSIFEGVLLRRIDTITPLTLLIALSTINFERFNSITAEPPSLYMFVDGSHAAAVLFRDKRVEVLFRDKRAHVSWRDKRGD